MEHSTTQDFELSIMPFLSTYASEITGLLVGNYLVERPDQRAKGMLQPNPPIKPNMTNCQKGSDPDEPKIAPRVGINKVRYVIGKKITNFVLVAEVKTIVTSNGTLRVTPNSHKSNLESLVRRSLTRMKTELVAAPARLPCINIVNTLNQFMGT